MKPDVLAVDLDDAVVTVARWGRGPADFVLLHDGLGSIEQWRSIPLQLATRTGRTVVAYDRPGHGRSTPNPTGPWAADWLSIEADRLRLILQREAGEKPMIVGHSDGGSIGLLYAANHAAVDGPDIGGLLTLAAHTWVEQSCYDAILGMREQTERITTGLALSHADPEALFEAWSGVWVGEEFRPWNILDTLGRIDRPTLVAQGRQDEYASDDHAIRTAAAIGPSASCRLLDGVGHLLHHQDPEMVVDLVIEFDETLATAET